MIHEQPISKEAQLITGEGVRVNSLKSPRPIVEVDDTDPCVSVFQLSHDIAHNYVLHSCQHGIAEVCVCLISYRFHPTELTTGIIDDFEGRAIFKCI